MTGTHQDRIVKVWQTCVVETKTAISTAIKSLICKGSGELAEWLRSGLQIQNPRFDFTGHFARQTPRTYRERNANVRCAQ